MTTIKITRNNRPLPKYNPRKVLKNFQFGIYTYQAGVLTTPRGNKYKMELEDYLYNLQPFCQKYITVSIQEKTWENFYALWINEELEFEGALWQDINPIVVIIDELEERKGYEDSEYSIELKEKLEAMKKEFLEKWN